MSNEQAPTNVESKVTPPAPSVLAQEDGKNRKNGGGGKAPLKVADAAPQKPRGEIVLGELHALGKHFANLPESRVDHLDRQFVDECLSRVKRGIALGTSEYDRSNKLAVKYLKNK